MVQLLLGYGADMRQPTFMTMNSFGSEFNTFEMTPWEAVTRPLPVGEVHRENLVKIFQQPACTYQAVRCPLSPVAYLRNIRCELLLDLFLSSARRLIPHHSHTCSATPLLRYSLAHMHARTHCKVRSLLQSDLEGDVTAAATQCVNAIHHAVTLLTLADRG